MDSIVPCITGKCLVFPACKNKNNINCDKLVYHYCKLRQCSMQERRNNLLKLFPNLVLLTNNDQTDSYIIQSGYSGMVGPSGTTCITGQVGSSGKPGFYCEVCP